VRVAERELSRRTLSFEAVTAMQEAAASTGLPRPVPQALKSARLEPPAVELAAEPAAGPAALPGADPAGSGGVVRLPARRPASASLRAALAARRSSFGRFSGHRPTRPDQLATVLAAAAAAADFTCDVSAPGENLGLAGLYVFANHVASVAPGIHRYDPVGHRLVPVAAGARGRFLQDTYFLDNYNVEQAGAVLVPTVRAAAVLDAVGPRGYRLTNAVVGAVAQAVYTAAPAVGLGCGVALGFDNVAYAEQFGVQDTDESPLLIMMVGHERSQDADYRYDLV
jgi:SagB-type dehydrogenase family enzyme